MQLLKITFLLLFLLILSGCNNSPTVNSDDSKLSSHEAGTIDQISEYLNQTTKYLKLIRNSRREAKAAKAEKNYGIAKEHSTKALSNVYKLKDWINKFQPVNGINLIYPQTMVNVGITLEKLIETYQSMPSTGELEKGELKLMVKQLKELVKADKDFSRLVSSRETNPDILNPKIALNVAIKPFPFTLDILSGEVTIRHTIDLGFASVTPSLKPGKEGVTKLILIHKGEARIYKIGGRKLNLLIRGDAIMLESSGDTMTITTIE